jgi:hypothetical protein
MYTKIIFNEVLELRNYLRLRYVPFLDVLDFLDLRVLRLALRLPPIIIIWFVRRFLRAEGVEAFVIATDEFTPEAFGRPDVGTP